MCFLMEVHWFRPMGRVLSSLWGFVYRKKRLRQWVIESCPPKPDSFVIRVFGDPFGLYGSRIEGEPVRLHIHSQYVLDLCDYISLLIARYSKHINVHGRTKFRRAPNSQHQSPFENESVDVHRLGQPVEESLHGIVLKQLVEWTSVTFGSIEKALPDGGGYVLGVVIPSPPDTVASPFRPGRSWRI